MKGKDFCLHELYIKGHLGLFIKGTGGLILVKKEMRVVLVLCKFFKIYYYYFFCTLLIIGCRRTMNLMYRIPSFWFPHSFKLQNLVKVNSLWIRFKIFLVWTFIPQFSNFCLSIPLLNWGPYCIFSISIYELKWRKQGAVTYSTEVRCLLSLLEIEVSWRAYQEVKLSIFLNMDL